MPEAWELEGPPVSISLGEAADLDPALLAAITGPDGLGGNEVFGAMTKGSALEVGFEDLTGAGIITKAGFKSVFIAATMSPPGIEPPLELR